MKSKKLDSLHECFLSNPPTRKEEVSSIAEWQKAASKLDAQRRDMKRAVIRQKDLAMEKKEAASKAREAIERMNAELAEMKARHAKACAAIEREELTIVGKASKAYESILVLSEVGRKAKLALDTAAERLVITHGLSPIQIGSKTYDFGCHGERVYLVPRSRQSMPKKTKR